MEATERSNLSEEMGENDRDVPAPGHVRSLISKLESAFDQESPESAIIKNGTPKLSVNSLPISKDDDNEELDCQVASEENEIKIQIEAQPSCGPSEDQSSTQRKFQWFSSLKRTKSKTRRSSQFYSETPTNELSETTTQHDNTIDSPELISGCFDDSEATSICSGSISTEFAPLDSDGDSAQNIDAQLVATGSTSRKSYLAAKELVSSEETYVKTLRLLDVHFRNLVEYENHNSKSKVIPDVDLQKIFNQLPELKSLNEDLLSDLQASIMNWENSPKIAGVLVKKGPFLKMYAAYIQNFEMQTQFLDECCVKYLKFGKLVKSFEAGDICKKLTLKHYMLKPVQRITQYRLLLDEYLKHLSETSPDYEDTLRALRIVTNVADHINNSMRHGDEVGRMVQLQSMLSEFQLVKPGRELIKDGPLQKICRKTAKDRYFILLNDCLLYSTLSKTYLKFHQTLSLGGMKVTYSDDDINMHTFAVYSTTKSFILCAKSEGERKEWVEALSRAIDDFVSRKKSFQVNVAPMNKDAFHLGKEAPLWIPDGKVTMCQECTAEFKQLFRRHHCRACGKVFCWRCSDNMAPLQYKKYKAQRVCDQCFDQLLEDFENNEDEIKKGLKLEDDSELQNEFLAMKGRFVRSNHGENKQKKSVPTRLMAVTAKDAQADYSGWLKKCKMHRWKVDRNWYVLKDRVLYIYRASEDVAACKSISVLGYRIEKGQEPIDGIKPQLIFQLTHPQQLPITFAADSEQQADRWFQVLSKAATFDDL